ncbi:hypothetical protein Ah1_00229 [Aeromonas phage Ah1]|uniref:Uncharacterized protein n=1 Tax=Aeromonas phage Ah1 TaxID=2053701 RepID=A0A2H4YF00_9CAUD|nr:hypothetical protein KNT77_gp289 [Aeromonas phage Ah1]AUE22747.1 hypothetical protein Ah1_00229 [Aeromonas phage Ah1]
MQAIILFMLKRVGTEVLLQMLKQLVKILEKRIDNNFGSEDVDAIEKRVEVAKDPFASPIAHPGKE